ncbi:hypothetical protein BDD12DRAFT_911777 [Trichophaea hybrida]|nr:hypothetical protein BDD12DRAFT_911777 [Trichophaea hybrida]
MDPNIRTTRSGASYATPIDVFTPSKPLPAAAPHSATILTDNVLLEHPSTASTQENPTLITISSDDSDETLLHPYPVWDSNSDSDSLSELSLSDGEDEDTSTTLDNVEPQGNDNSNNTITEESIIPPPRTVYNKMPPPKQPVYPHITPPYICDHDDEDTPTFFTHPHPLNAPCPIDNSVLLRESPRSPSPTPPPSEPAPASPPEIWLALIQQYAGTGSYHAVLSTLQLWRHNEINTAIMLAMMRAHLSMHPQLLKGFERLYNVSVFVGESGTVEEVMRSSGKPLKTRGECEKELALLL